MRKTSAAPEFAHFPADWHLSPVVDTGDLIFFSGITGTNPDLRVSDDHETQFRDAFTFVRANLAVANLKFSDAVEMTTYYVDLRRHIDVFMKVKDEFISEPYPAWTAIGVSELITEGTLIGIRMIAQRQ